MDGWMKKLSKLLKQTNEYIHNKMNEIFKRR